MPRFEALCRAIIDAGLDDVDYIVQGMTAPIAAHGETLAPLMRQAGFRYVFLGIENVLDEDLAFLKARAKNSRRDDGRPRRNATIDAIDVLHRHGMLVVGGLIVGNPDDTPRVDRREPGVRARARRLAVHPASDAVSGHADDARVPSTRALIVNRRVDEYDGTTAVTRSAHLDAEEIEFMRWRAERWMKVRHMPTAFRHDPAFVLRNGRRMLAHTFRGSTWRSALRSRERAHRVLALPRDPARRARLRRLARPASAVVGPRRRRTRRRGRTSRCVVSAG